MASKKKTSRSRSKKSSSKGVSARAVHDPLSKSALKLIDQASDMLKRSVVAGSKQTVKGRQALKKRAYTLLHTATRRLNNAIDQGSRAIRKGLSRM